MTRAFKIHEAIILKADPNYNIDRYLEKKRQAVAGLELFVEELHSLAKTQVGKHSFDSEVLDAVYIAISPAGRWHKQFAKLDTTAVGQLENIFIDLVELGLVFHLLEWDTPERPNPPDIIDVHTFRDKWLSEAYIADVNMRRIVYQGVADALMKQVIRAEVLPFCKSHGLGGGFLGWNGIKLAQHARWLFYAGAWLGVLYDVSSVYNGVLVPPSY